MITFSLFASLECVKSKWHQKNETTYETQSKVFCFCFCFVCLLVGWLVLLFRECIIYFLSDVDLSSNLCLFYLKKNCAAFSAGHFLTVLFSLYLAVFKIVFLFLFVFRAIISDRWKRESDAFIYIIRP